MIRSESGSSVGTHFAPVSCSIQSRDNNLPSRVTWIANFVPPYAAPMYLALSENLTRFRLLLSTEMEKCRSWAPDVNIPNVQVQRTLSWTYQSRHPSGFADKLQVHFPYDTIPILLKEKPQVVISSELGARTLQAFFYRLFYRNSRLVIRATVSEVSEQGRGRLRRWIRSLLLRRADAVIVNGQSGCRYIRSFGVPPNKLFTVPYTMETTTFAQVPLERAEEESFRLIYVGQLIERKGLFPFFRIIRQWAAKHRHRTISFWIVGGGILRERLDKEVLPSNVIVKFLGSLRYRDLPRIYAQCGVLVFPTFSDEWGMVVNEAMMAGLPVLGSIYSQAVEELVRDGENGWCFRPDSDTEMYSAIDRAMGTSKDKIAVMRRNARQAVAYLTPSHACKGVLEALRFVWTETQEGSYRATSS